MSIKGAEIKCYNNNISTISNVKIFAEYKWYKVLVDEINVYLLNSQTNFIVHCAFIHTDKLESVYFDIKYIEFKYKDDTIYKDANTYKDATIYKGSNTYKITYEGTLYHDHLPLREYGGELNALILFPIIDFKHKINKRIMTQLFNAGIIANRNTELYMYDFDKIIFMKSIQPYKFPPGTIIVYSSIDMIFITNLNYLKETFISFNTLYNNIYYYIEIYIKLYGVIRKLKCNDINENHNDINLIMCEHENCKYIDSPYIFKHCSLLNCNEMLKILDSELGKTGIDPVFYNSKALRL